MYSPFSFIHAAHVERCFKSTLQNPHCGCTDDCPSKTGAYFQYTVFAILRLYLKFYFHGGSLYVGRYFRTLQIGGCGSLQPNRLPYAGRLYIPTPKIVCQPSLLAAWLARVEGVFHLNGDDIFSFLYSGSNFKGEPGVSTGMGSHLNAVDPYSCFVITAFKMQEYMPGLYLGPRKGDAAAIPNTCMHCFIANSTGPGLISKRDLDCRLSWQSPFPAMGETLFVIIKCKIPYPVQVLPAFSK